MPDLSEMGERFASKVEVDTTTGCWVWTSAIRHGYGAYWLDKRAVQAHRHAYQTLVRTLSPAEVLDHICFQRRCVNPEHLRPVTNKQNGEHRQGSSANSTSGVRGVCWDAYVKKWKASIGHAGKDIHGGYFSTIAEAEQRVIEMRAELFTHDDYDGRADAQSVSKGNE